jgi:hypothetical protein
VLVAGFTGCKNAEVAGKVLDNFGHPLPGATVTVDKTTFTTTTDNNGSYSVGYVPGKVLVTISKPGYLSQNLDLDIATETSYPAQALTLYKLPAGRGIFFFGASDYTALPLGQVSDYQPLGVYTMASGLQQEPMTSSVKGNYVTIGGGTELTFLSTDQRDIKLYGVRPDGVYAVVPNMGPMTATVYQDKVVHITPGITVRKATLPSGKYAFVDLFGFDGGKVAYLFEVK